MSTGLRCCTPRKTEETRLGQEDRYVAREPAGLGAAYRLAELGTKTGKFSSAMTMSAVWSSSYTDEHGFIWDHGGHVMFSHYSYFDDLVEKDAARRLRSAHA